MKPSFLRLQMILVGAMAVPAWGDDVKPVPQPPPVVVDVKGVKDKPDTNNYESQFESLVTECGVTDANAKQLLGLLQAWDTDTRMLVDSVKPGSPDLALKLEAIDKELEAATKSNDTGRIRDLSEKRQNVQELMDGWSPETRQQLVEMDNKYRGAVREMVAPDKFDRMDEILDAAQDAQPHRARRGPVRSPRALKAIVDRLGDLTPEQRRSVDGLFAQFREGQRESTGREQDKNVITRKLYDDVFAVLTDGQKTRVEQQLAGRTGAAAPKDPATPAAGAPANAGGKEKTSGMPTPPAKGDVAKP